MTEPTRERIVVGCMTGTSLDGLDAARVRIVGTGLDMSAEYLGHVSLDMPPALRETLFHLASGGAAEPLVYLRAARALGEFYADGVRLLLDDTKGPTPDFVVAHGQTIWHAPRPRKEDEGQPDLDLGPMSWQLFDPWPVVNRVGVPVCYDLRQADLIAGGEGAPLTPLADWVMYRDATCSRLVVNLGGIANITHLPMRCTPLQLAARDYAPCNLLIDGMVQICFPDLRYDTGGEIAASGRFSGAIYAEVGRAPIPEGSSGREVFSPGWVQRLRETILDEFSAVEAVSAAVEAVAMWVADAAFEADVSHVILAGGGCLNRSLVGRVREKLSGQANLSLSDDLGIPCEAREAMGFAVLGALSQDGVPVSLPQVTGAKDPGVAGVWAGV